MNDLGDEEDYEWELESDRPGERLLSLTLVVLSNPNGLTKEEIFASVRGYQSYVSENKMVALEKIFTRDKSTLLDIGIQIEAFIPKHAPEDNTQTKYRINSAKFVWPANTKLTPAQLRLMELATKVWAKASLSSDAQRAVTRLRALGLPSEGLDLSGFAPRILTNEPGFIQLNDAIQASKVVEFKYRAPEADVTQRRVRPLMLKNIAGQWLLMCWDIQADDFRNFLLKRIVSKITTTDETFESATMPLVTEAEQRLDDFIASNLATIRVQPDTQAWVHFGLDSGGLDEDGTYNFHYMDLHLLADELRQYGKSVEVVAPEALKQAIRRGLEKVVSQHA